MVGMNTPVRSLADSPLIRAYLGRPTPHRPVWFMRQAGRSLPEYREIRADVPMLEACRRPELVCEITLQPVRRHGVDAAILFSDIVVPLAAAGVGVEIVAGTGPVVAQPVRAAGDLARLPGSADLDFIDEAVRLLVAELGPVPLIGFAGAPFTLASYLVEGGPSRTHARTKALMYSQPQTWHALCERLAELTAQFLRVQVTAGASAIQLFDSWAGALSEADYRRYVQPHSGAVLRSLSDLHIPRVHFGVGTAELLPAMAEAGADVIGVDWRTPLPAASARLGHRRPLQGNLDPCVLLAPWPVIEAEVRRVLDEGQAAPGHVFNLGHGVLPETDPAVLTRVVELVHRLTADDELNR